MIPDHREAGRNSVAFFALSPESALSPGSYVGDPGPPPAGLEVINWRPTWRSWRPPGFSEARWAIWAFAHHARAFRNREFAVQVLTFEGDAVHRACVFPRCARFPFMGMDDLQFGDVWTENRWRGRHLATWSLSALVHQYQAAGRSIWYLTNADNIASVKLIERSGFQRVGTGDRERPFGVSLLAQYRLRNDFR